MANNELSLVGRSVILIEMFDFTIKNYNFKNVKRLP